VVRVRCYPLDDEAFRVLAVAEVARLGDDPQPQLLEHSLRRDWPAVRVVRIEPTGPYGDPIMYVFRDGHVGTPDGGLPA
jgi:hypothetical protein